MGLGNSPIVPLKLNAFEIRGAAGGMVDRVSFNMRMGGDMNVLGLGLYGREECLPLDTEALTNREAEELCNLIGRLVIRSASILVLDGAYISQFLRKQLNRHHLDTYGQCERMSPAQWAALWSFGRRTYEELWRLAALREVRLPHYDEIHKCKQ